MQLRRNELAFDLDDAALLASMTDAAREAGEIALAWFKTGATTSASIESKHGGSPVTEADFAVDNFLRPRLEALVQQAGWLSEETVDTPDRLSRDLVFVVDPIDGTRAFIKGDARWAISIALVQAGRPRVGVLHLPAVEETYAAITGAGATLNGRPIRASRQVSLTGGRIAGPPRQLEAMKHAGLQFEAAPRVPSLAYRLALVADGRLAAGLASSNACDWDIAAADLLLSESGATLADHSGVERLYTAPDPRHPALTAAPTQLGDELRRVLLRSSNDAKASTPRA